ncbi:PadR family transcriptional regulator [Microbacterium marinilacus]|uniref:Helix-turn-helix transcriptional regulator n=1 Tax=Microbacterium marinilacus TaxID=415209 RepID=A0ABP7B9X4_9MICO|nr:PadR family transcriptional regulator [Microbacterium marinilacus]MBY0687243.1 PadR family transcriptional regulator [Microbacterium marinilacus]
MSVRQSLLAILDQGPCYGYQLRAEFQRRTGSTWPLNVGQVYNTLERLERDGLVARGDADDQGHVFWEITAEGRGEVASWLGLPVEPGRGARDDLAIKVALAATLPGVDLGAVIRTQRDAVTRRLERLRDTQTAESDRAADEGPEQLARALVMESMVLQAEAEAAWLDRVEQRVAAHPGHAVALGLSSERPRRGRPARATATARA